MHTLLDYDGNLPAYVNITADNKGAYGIPLVKRSVMVADRFYNDFKLLNVWDSNAVFFLIRHKENLKFRAVKELERSDNRHEHILKDEIIESENEDLKKKYRGKLRPVSIWNDENKQMMELIKINHENLDWASIL